MEIRKLELWEHEDSRQLYEEVFDEDSPSFVGYYYREKTRDNQIYVVEEDGKIRSMLHLNPYRMYVNGSGKDVNYVVAVATQKEYRKRGYMAALLKRSLEDMYEAGELFTFLMPASESIYLPFDFRTVYEQRGKFFQAEEVAPDVSVSDARECDCRELAEAANRCLAGKYRVFAIRDEAYYRRLIHEYESDGGKLKVYRQNGEIIDYYDRMENLKSHVDGRFFQCHRSYLVNLDYVRGCEAGQVLLPEGEKIPVSRLRERELTQALLCHMKERRGAERHKERP